MDDWGRTPIIRGERMVTIPRSASSLLALTVGAISTPALGQEPAHAAARLDGLQATRSDTAEVRISAKPGDGLKITAGDAFSLGLLNWLQPQFRFTANEDTNPASNGGAVDVGSFSIAQARTRLTGNVVDKDIEYGLMADWTESPTLKEAWARVTPYRAESFALALRFGQQKTLYGREATAA